MKFSGWRFCALVSLVSVASVFFVGRQPHAQSASTSPIKTKVIIYPSADETIEQLKEQGISQIENYGSYWVATATDGQIDALKKTYEDRVTEASQLNRISLSAMTIDTTLGEPSVPSELQERTDSGSKRLRLIQFKGPVKPNWLNQIQGAGDVRVISYIPNNAYLVWLDSKTEQKLAGLFEPNGPVQWIGAYHPYYKISPELLSAPGAEPTKVRVSVVDQSGLQAESGAYALGFVRNSLKRDGQEIIEMGVWGSNLTQIARLPDVVWIEKVAPKHILDEVQGLVLLDQTNQPPLFSPTPGLHYLDFLTNAVGGGMSEFTNPATYPVVDIADTGLDNGSFFPFHPAFYNLGNPNSFPRISNLLPPWLAGNPVQQLGCTTRITDEPGAAFRPLETADLDGHGTFVASILAGYDTGTNIIAKPSLVLQTVSTNRTQAIPGTDDQGNIFACPISGTTNVTIAFDAGVTNVCGGSHIFTNFVVAVDFANCPTTFTTNILLTKISTQFLSEVRTDANGFQYGMGVSPFGVISINRLWGTMESDVFSISVRNNVCTAFYRATGLCLNDFVTLMSEAYVFSFARIENNSWADVISTTGDNGGRYTADSQTFDIGVRDAVVADPNSVASLNQEFIVVFACNSLLNDAGNQGNAGGFADQRVTAPATAKNVISVGSSVNPRLDPQFACFGGSSLDMFSQSAAGPTVDGRFKPEIVAPGAAVAGAFNQLAQGFDIGLTGLTSTNCTLDQLLPFAPFITNSIDPTCNSTQTLYTALYTCRPGGSSFAAPAVSGAIQLLWWYFEHRLTNDVGQLLSQPSPAMAKAYLCNSARYLPITNPQSGTRDRLPSILQGMGELDLARMFDGVPRVIRDESSPRALDVPLVPTNRAPQQTYFTRSGQAYKLQGKILSNGLPFRVTLAWVDAPGNPAVTKQLVNDLDLQVTIGAQTYKGNVFSEDQSILGGGFDDKNNLESVFLTAGSGAVTAGAPYQVVVTARTIAGPGVPRVGTTNDQDFALVVYNSGTGTFGTPSATSDAANLATNDTCQTAIIISNTVFSFTNDLTSATYSDVHPSPSIATGGIEEFFKIPVPVQGTTFSVLISGSNLVTSIWRGDCGSLEEVSSSASAPALTNFVADGTNDYYIVVDGANNRPALVQLNVAVVCTAITLSPLTLPNANIGQFYSETISAANGVAPYTFTVSSGSVPTGLSLADTGLLSGTPTAGGSFTFTVTATDAIGCIGTNTYTISVICPTITLSPTAFPDASIGIPYSQSNSAVGGTAPYTFVMSSGSPPAGLTYSNAVLSGTPTTAGTNSFTITVTDSFGCTTNRAYTLAVIPPSPLVCLDTGTLSFGSVSVGSTSAVQSVTVTNCGTAALSVTGVGITGANAGDFHIVGTNACSSVATGSTCAISVDFAPTGTGVRTATLAITNNAVGSPRLVSLTGTSSIGQPDAAIGKTTKVKKLVGNGVISSTGVGEEFIQKVKRGAKRGSRFFIALKNIGTSADQFKVLGDGDSGGFTVKYFLGATGTTDITPTVEAGIHASSTLAPGAITGNDTMIRVEVFADTAVPKGTVKSFAIKFTSASDPTKVDVVKATVIAK